MDETSLLVVGREGDDGGALLGYLKLGKKYGQDLILHKPHSSERLRFIELNETEKHKHIEVGFWQCPLNSREKSTAKEL